MKELCWATDIHLDHAHPEKQKYFVRKVNERDTEVVCIGGDVSNGVEIVKHLQYLSNQWSDKKIYFVLGNHDYYGSSLNEVWDGVDKCVSEHDNLVWLDRSGFVKLSDQTALVGSGLWCDWRAGNYKTSNVWLADYKLIHDFHVLCMGGGWAPEGFYTDPLRRRLHQLAKQHSDQLVKDLKDAINAGYKKVFALTHVPPFWEGSFHEGKVQEADWAVHFVCKIAGDMLKEVMEQHTDVHLTVLCGHTHGYGEIDILPNLHVINGPAAYKKPKPQKPIYYD